jgi:very-short-patch-repair endonuclease
MHTKYHNQKSITPKRQLLRKTSTHAETHLWHHLKSTQLKNHKFRRQHSIGNFITDFYFPKEKLVIEIDGNSHFTKESQEYDAKRTKFLNSLNIRVIRFTNLEVLQNTEGVLLEIIKHFNN